MGTLGASLLGDIVSKSLFKGKCVYRTGYENKKQGKGTNKEGLKKALISGKPHRLTNIEIINYYKSEPRFNGVYSRDNLPKKKKKWSICSKFR